MILGTRGWRQVRQSAAGWDKVRQNARLRPNWEKTCSKYSNQKLRVLSRFSISINEDLLVGSEDSDLDDSLCYETGHLWVQSDCSYVAYSLFYIRSKVKNASSAAFFGCATTKRYSLCIKNMFTLAPAELLPSWPGLV